MNHRKLLWISIIWIVSFTAAIAAPTMAGKVKSYGNGILVIERDDHSVQKFAVSKQTTVHYMGRATSVAALPVGAKISIEVIGSLGVSPLKAGKIVDWGSSSKIVAVGAKAPYYTAVGQYAASNGTGGMPDGAPVGNHSATHMLGAVALGGSVNAATPQNTPTTSAGASANPQAYSSMGQPAQSTQYINQGQSTTAPLEMMNINPYGGQTSGSSSAPSGGIGGVGGSPEVTPAMMGIDPSLGLQPMTAAQAQASMGMGANAATDPSYGMTSLATGQATSLMGITGDGSEEDYSAAGDMMGVAAGGMASADSQKLTGNIIEVDLQRGVLTLQSFTNPQPQRVLMGVASSCPPDLLVPGKMVEVTGRLTPGGFQASEIRAAAGF